METFLNTDRLVFNPPELGCMLYLPGLPGDGSKIYDRSPYCNIGTIVGAIWARLRSGLWCLTFDGVDDYVDSGNVLASGTLYSFEAWVKVDAVSAEGTFIDTRSTGYANGFTVYHGTTGKVMLYTTTGGEITTTDEIDDNLWHHLVGTDSDGAKKIYIDAVEKASGTKSFNGHSTSSQCRIGTNATGAADLAGIMTLIRLYNYCLDPFTIQSHFNREKHLFGVW